MWVLISREAKISAFLCVFRMYSCPWRGRLYLIRRTADWLSQKIHMSVKPLSALSLVAMSVAFIIP